MSTQKCQAAKCKSRCRDAVKFFNFPTDGERRRLWIAVCERKEGWEPTSRNQKLCQVHFDDDQFENRRVDGWRKLKWNAVPTIKTSVLTTSEAATVKLEDPTYGIKTEPLYQGYEERLMSSVAPGPPNGVVDTHESTCRICDRPLEFYPDTLCKVCEKKFEFDQESKIRKKKNFRMVIKYQCEECLKNFSNLNMYQRHVKCHDAKKPYVCTHAQCQKRFYLSKDLVPHMESHENSSDVSNTISTGQLSTRFAMSTDSNRENSIGTEESHLVKSETLDSHLNTQLKKPESSELAMKIFENPFGASSVIEIGIFGLFSCEDRRNETADNQTYCDESYSSNTLNSPTEINEIIVKEEPGIVESTTYYNSSLVDVDFQKDGTESSLVRYEIKEIKDEDCDEKVVAEAANQNQNDDTPRESYICKYCSKDFMYFGNYAKHLEQHSIGKLMCKFCNQIFCSTYQIRKHIRDFHSNQEMFVCSACFATLPKHSFASHMRTHRIDDKTLICKYCGSRFSEPSELFHHFKNRHYDSAESTISANSSQRANATPMQHEETRNDNEYKCKYCGTKFGDVLKLYHHVKVHIKQTNAAKRLVNASEDFN